jgi:hypothetical protein
MSRGRTGWALQKSLCMLQPTCMSALGGRSVDGEVCMLRYHVAVELDHGPAVRKRVSHRSCIKQMLQPSNQLNQTKQEPMPLPTCMCLFRIRICVRQPCSARDSLPRLQWVPAVSQAAALARPRCVADRQVLKQAASRRLRQRAPTWPATCRYCARRLAVSLHDLCTASGSSRARSRGCEGVIVHTASRVNWRPARCVQTARVDQVTPP